MQNIKPYLSLSWRRKISSSMQHKYLKSSRSANKQLKLFTSTQHFSLRLQSAMQLSNCKNLVQGGSGSTQTCRNLEQRYTAVLLKILKMQIYLPTNCFNDYFEIILLESAFPSKSPVTPHCKKCVSAII